MADVQVEDGYTRIANVLLEKIASSKLNGCQHAVVLIVWRYTYGFKRKEHDLSAGFIAKATSYNKRQIEREIVVLVRRKILFQKVVNGVSRTIGFNKDFESWDTPGELADGQEADGKLTDGELADTPPADLPTVTPGELADQEINSFKENLKESTTTGKDDFLKVSRAYGRIHGRYDVEPKHYPLLTRLLDAGLPPETMIEIMEQKHREKTAVGETISSFGYYEPVFKDRLNPKFKVYSGNRDVDWGAIEKQMKEAERGSKPGA